MNSKKLIASTMMATVLLGGLSSTASASEAIGTKSAVQNVVGDKTANTPSTKALKKFSTTKKIADYYTVDKSDVKNYGKGFFMIKSEGFLKLNGKAYKGVFKGKMYKGGRLASGELDGLVYYEGKLVNNDAFLGVYYKQGKPLTGALKNEHFTNGLPTTGLIKDEATGKYFKDGTLFYGEVDGKYYEKGKIFSGISIQGKYYVDGIKSSGIVDGIKYVGGYKASGYGYNEQGELTYYEDGKPYTGINSEGLKIVDGKEFTGFEGKGLANSGKEYDVYYEKGKAFTGFAVAKGTTNGEKVEMENGIVKDGDYPYQDTTIRFVEGKFVGFVGGDGKIVEGTAPQN